MINQHELPAVLRLLVVDDEPIVGKRLQQVYRKMGFEVETYTGADAALAAMARQPFEIVVTDLRMDGTDGWELLRQVRAMNQNTRVIIITAYVQDETVTRAYRQGAFGIVVKPFRLEELKQIIYSAVEDFHGQPNSAEV